MQGLTQFADGQVPVAQALTQPGMNGQPALPPQPPMGAGGGDIGAQIATTVAQIAAMPPKQAQVLVQMHLQKAQQDNDALQYRIWENVMQQLQAAQPQAQGNVVSNTLGGQFQ